MLLLELLHLQLALFELTLHLFVFIDLSLDLYLFNGFAVKRESLEDRVQRLFDFLLRTLHHLTALIQQLSSRWIHVEEIVRRVVPTLTVTTYCMLEESWVLSSKHRPRLAERCHCWIVNTTIITPLHLSSIIMHSTANSTWVVLLEIQRETRVLRIEVTLLDVWTPRGTLLFGFNDFPLNILAPGMSLDHFYWRVRESVLLVLVQQSSQQVNHHRI